MVFEVSGGGGGNHHKTFLVADCAGYAAAIEEEMRVLEEVHKRLDCNCGIGDCYIIESIFGKVISANTLPEPTMSMGTNDFPLLRTIAENSGPSFTSGIKAGKNCFHVKINKKFTSGTALLDLTKHQIKTAQSQILIKDQLDQSGIEITLLPASKGSFEDLVAYLGFGGKEKTDFTGTLTHELLKKIFPKVEPDLSKDILPFINQYLKSFNMNSCEERIMFFTQIAEETDNLGLLTEVESDWASSTSKFKGRGILQLTGSRNYKNFGEYCQNLGDDVNFIENPENIDLPKYTVLSAFWFWNENNCKKYSSELTEDNMLKIAKIINCGSITSNCSHNNQEEPCYNCKPNGWERRKKEFERLSKTFNCKN